MAQINADMTNTEPAQNFGGGGNQPGPGKHTAYISQSDFRDNRAGTGKIIELTWLILDGKDAGKSIRQFLNYSNPNDVAERIGKEQLRKILDSIGHPPRLEDTASMHNRPAIIELAEGEANAQGKVFMQIKNIEPLPQQVPQQQTQHMPPPPIQSQGQWK